MGVKKQYKDALEKAIHMAFALIYEIHHISSEMTEEEVIHSYGAQYHNITCILYGIFTTMPTTLKEFCDEKDREAYEDAIYIADKWIEKNNKEVEKVNSNL